MPVTEASPVQSITIDTYRFSPYLTNSRL